MNCRVGKGPVKGSRSETNFPLWGRRSVPGLKREEIQCRQHLHSIGIQSPLCLHYTAVWKQNLEMSEYKPTLRKPGLKPLLEGTMHTLCLQLLAMHIQLKKRSDFQTVKDKKHKIAERI